MGLIGLILASIVNLFLRSQRMDYILCIVGVLIFVGLTAYDTRKIKQIGENGYYNGGVAVIAALALYLDFVNLFLYLLRLMGRRR